MISCVQYIQKGTVYRLRNRRASNYLTNSQQLSLQPLQRDKVTQLWLLDEIKPNTYEIVSMQTGQVLARRDTIVIEKGNWAACQFWKLERAEIVKDCNYFWILPADADEDGEYLFGSAADSKVSMKSFDNTLFGSNWEIEAVDLDADLPGCCIFKSEYSGYVIDVPQASNKDGVNIIQYTFNGRGNQRWVLQKVIDSFVIRNLCSNMILSPTGKPKSGTKIMQTQFTNKPQEKWIFEQEGDKNSNRFSIRNRMDNTLFLGVASTRESASVQLVGEKEKGVWMLDGPFFMMLLS